MIIEKRIVVHDSKRNRVVIGNSGEYGVTHIIADLSEYLALGEGIATAVYALPYASEEFPVACHMEGKNLIIPVTAAMTQKQGVAELRIHYLVENGLKKSSAIECLISNGGYNSTEAPDIVEEWLDSKTRDINALEGKVNSFMETFDDTLEDYAKKEDIPDTEDFARKEDIPDTYSKEEVDGKISQATPSDYAFVKEKVSQNAYAITVGKESFQTFKDATETNLQGKLDKPEEAPVAGKVLKIKSVNEDGTFVCEWAEESGGITLDDIPIAQNLTYGLVKPNQDNGIKVYSDGLGINSATESQIEARKSNYRPIVPANLEKAVTSVIDFKAGGNPQRRRMVEEADLEHYVKDTDYASGSKGGTVKVSDVVGIGILSSGVPTAQVRTASQYSSASNNLFIGKGTLENIKEDLVKSVTNAPPELLLTVTLTEDTHSIIVNKFSDGTPLKLMGAIIFCENVQTSSSATSGLIRTYGKYNGVTISQSYNDSWKNSMAYSTVLMMPMNGFWINLRQNASATGTFNGNFALNSFNQRKMSLISYPYISEIEINTNGTVPMSSGTISIYGIKA